MNRLTENPCGKKAGCKIEKSPNAECCYAGCVNFQRVLNRLSEYEDTGLTPGNITYQTAQLQEWQRKCALMPIDNAKLRAELKRVKRERDAAINGETSDGYHTFNELYHHRAVLFSVICNSRTDIAWKSKLHHDGTMYDGMFIVGINTPDGQATYHYDIDPYWNMFSVSELLQSPEWDGHTPEQAIERIGRLSDRWIPVTERMPEEGDTVLMWHKDGFVMLALNMFDEMDDVSYWMPLPQPPETSKGIRKFTLSEFADAYAEIAPALCKAVAVDIKWTCVNCGYPNDADNIKCWACGQLRRE